MLLAILVSVLIVFGAPYAGELRSAIQSSFPQQYRWIIGGVVATAVLFAIAAAMVRLRREPLRLQPEMPRLPLWMRYSFIGVALALSIAYARAVRSGVAEVDLVEAFHFVEYGAVTYLFYRVWSERPDRSGIVFTACAAIAVGIFDEFVQWFVPGRVGELHDVWLNSAAVGCGLLFSTAIRPPRSLAAPRRRRERLTAGIGVGGLVLLAAFFVDRVHIGYAISGGTIGTFRSLYDAEELATLVDERAKRWKTSAPPSRGFTREDHYLSEGQWHVQRRNEAFGDGDLRTAWGENAILEAFYEPVLQRGFRWTAGERTVVERSAGSPDPTFVSDAAPYPIYAVSRLTFWSGGALVVVAMMWLFSRGSDAPERVPV